MGLLFGGVVTLAGIVNGTGRLRGFVSGRVTAPVETAVMRPWGLTATGPGTGSGTGIGTEMGVLTGEGGTITGNLVVFLRSIEDCELLLQSIVVVGTTCSTLPTRTTLLAPAGEVTGTSFLIAPDVDIPAKSPGTTCKTLPT